MLLLLKSVSQGATRTSVFQGGYKKLPNLSSFKSDKFIVSWYKLKVLVGLFPTGLRENSFCFFSLPRWLILRILCIPSSQQPPSCTSFTCLLMSSFLSHVDMLHLAQGLFSNPGCAVQGLSKELRVHLSQDLGLQ